MTGFDVMTVNGGYKAYRTHVLEVFDNQSLILNRIGGKTGTGKTEILYHLTTLGEQVIDLEGLAHHKGSAFGSLGELPQPSVEHFENRLFDKIRTADLSKRIWVENESRSIGRCFLPAGFWDKFSDSKLYNIEIPNDARIQRLCDDYAKYDVNDLIAVFKNIERKIGGQNAQTAIAALEVGDYPTATQIALFWYDKTYQFGLDSTKAFETVYLTFPHADMKKIAEELHGLG
jgi:tRNA 2-selenouridine synthase